MHFSAEDIPFFFPAVWQATKMSMMLNVLLCKVDIGNIGLVDFISQLTLNFPSDISKKRIDGEK